LPNLSVVLAHLRSGGVEKAVVGLLNALEGRRFRCRLILGRREGALLPELRPEIAVTDLGGARAMTSVPRLARLLGRDCDVVYSATNARNVATLAALRLLPAARRPRVIVSEHTTPDDYLAAARRPALRRAAMRLLYPRADALAAPAEGLAERWLAAAGTDRPRPVTLPNPIMTEAGLALAGRVERGEGPPRDPALVVAAGRLAPVKGFDLLLEAFARAAARRPELRLEIYGEGEARAALEAQAEALALQGRVRLRGYAVSLPEALAGAGLMVVPSRREGFGNVVVEALAAGTPVLATDCAGPAALLAETPGAGRLVPLEDPGALAEAMVQMAGAPAPLAAAARHGPALARRFGTEAAAARFADLAESLLG
jgi:glycosyltransferase involved in cell wall biosynthesis